MGWTPYDASTNLEVGTTHGGRPETIHKEPQMKTTNTLTSLAILKVNIDHGRDYLEYLRPFILQVLVDFRPTPVKVDVVQKHILDQFGLDIPARTIEIILKRISKGKYLEKKDKVYQIVGDLEDPRIAIKQSRAKRHIDSVISGLEDFSQGTVNPIRDYDTAVAAVCAFLARFDVACLRSYLRGTAIPRLGGWKNTDIVLVSDYIQFLQRTQPQRFDSFLILVQGHMLANALLCPDLQNLPKTYKQVIFYLDTPLLVQRLGVESESRQSASRELIDQVKNLGGRVATFDHSREELQNVLRGTANYLDSFDARGTIVREARKRGTTKSDLLLISESVDEKLREAGIVVDDTPGYNKNFQIDEGVFENVLQDEISYYNPGAKKYDINSVRSIYVLRGKKSPPSLEKAGAVLVTSNAAFAKAAWEYGKQHEAFKEVPSVITDFSLANLAWLKGPMGAPSIPKTQLLALSYGALEPSSVLLGKYLKEIDKLEEKGTITAKDHQLLRSSPIVWGELMHLTLGNDASLTEETVMQTLERLTMEIKKEESEKLEIEREEHRRTQIALDTQLKRNQKLISNQYWRCRRWAKFSARILSIVFGIVLVAGLLAGFGLRSANPIVAWVMVGGSIIVAVATLANLLVGSTVKDIHNWLRDRLEIWFLKRSAKSHRIDLSDFENID